MTKQQKAREPFLRFLFFVYCAWMLCLLFGRASGWIDGLSYREQLHQNINLQPFYTIGNYLHVLKYSTNAYLVRHCFINLAGNVLLFVPIGWLLPRLWKAQRKFFRFVVTCTGAVFLIETVQLFTLLGSFDVDDWILNLLGMLLGYLGYILFGRK